MAGEGRFKRGNHGKAQGEKTLGTWWRENFFSQSYPKTPFLLIQRNKKEPRAQDNMVQRVRLACIGHPTIWEKGKSLNVSGLLQGGKDS